MSIDTGLGKVAAFGMPWHGLIRDTHSSSGVVIDLPTGPTRICPLWPDRLWPPGIQRPTPMTLRSRPGDTYGWHLDAGAPFMPTPPDQAALGMQWTPDLILFGFDKRISPWSYTGIGYLSWIYAAGPAPLLCRFEIQYDKASYSAGDPVNFTVRVYSRPFGVFGGEPSPEVLRSESAFSTTAPYSGFTVFPHIDHLPDGSKALITLRIGPTGTPQQPASIDAKISHAAAALVECACAVVEYSCADWSATLLLSGAAMRQYSYTESPAAHPNTVMAVDESGDFPAAVGEIDSALDETVHIASCYGADGVVRHVRCRMRNSAGPAGAGTVSGPPQPTVDPPEMFDKKYVGDEEPSPCGIGVSYRVGGTLSEPGYDISVTNAYVEQFTAEIIVSGVVVDTMTLYGRSEHKRRRYKDGFELSAPQFCRRSEPDELGYWYDYERVLDNRPQPQQDDMQSITYVTCNGDTVARSTGTGAMSVILGSQLIEKLDHIRGWYRSFKCIPAGPRLFSLVGQQADHIVGSIYGRWYFIESVHSASAGESQYLDEPCAVGSNYRGICASFDYRTGVISIDTQAATPSGGMDPDELRLRCFV